MTVPRGAPRETGTVSGTWLQALQAFYDTVGAILGAGEVKISLYLIFIIRIVMVM